MILFHLFTRRKRLKEFLFEKNSFLKNFPPPPVNNNVFKHSIRVSYKLVQLDTTIPRNY